MLKLIKRCPEYVYGYKEYCQEAFGHNVIYFRPVNPELIDDGWFERTKEWYDIYVGKAISLKNRVRQYFQAGRNVTPKIERMISQIDHFEYIITDSEVEALVLESNLIKEHRPKYNTMLKDDKNYPYIRATIEEDYPRLLYSREQKRDKSKYFGPFTSAGAAKDTLELAHKIYTKV